MILAGGLDAGQRRQAIADLGDLLPWGVDVASGVEGAGHRKDAEKIRRFVRRCATARGGDEPRRRRERRAGPREPADERGHFGALRRPLRPRDADGRARRARRRRTRGVARDAGLRAPSSRICSRDYAGRPTPLYLARRLSEDARRRAIYLKREDLAHTGAHKINNALGPGLLARHMGKPRVIAETGAGQHGVATATACALLGLQCDVYMGAEDVARQALNVFRMELLGAEVRPVDERPRTLKDAINEALRDWVTNVRDTYYFIGSVMGPHPVSRRSCATSSA